MFRRLLKHGVLAGVAGGAALALVLRLIGEGPIGRAVALEGGGHDELFSRGTQQLGGMLAAVLYGAALGAVFTLAYALVRHRLQTTDDWRASVALAVAGFAGVFLLPFLKYPANPPAVGDPDTIGRRTALYLLALGWSAVATWAAWRAARALGDHRLPDHVRLPAVAALYVALVAVGLLALPPSPGALAAPAGLLWQFRLATVGGALALWAVAGTVFGWLELRRAPTSPVLGALRGSLHP